MTIAPSQLDWRHVGQTLVYTDKGRSRRASITGIEQKQTHTVAYVNTASGKGVVFLPPDAPITLEP
ncbi:hypothetical protein [Nocardia bovistercoris]|uniref:Uncharacterized protein n=1 Tax=Nocardia bovistercoris TaxID=2785916 RepID=A0A931ICB8_9NOCA|nr:hypothetical protein [Nocardia bovistercoris]MBH0778799.1 hypothetical protein [Nocardia bovistercoris]